MKKLFVSTVVAGLLVSGAAFAQDAGAVYGNLGYTHTTVDVTGGKDATFKGLTGRLGYQFSENFGVEGEATFSIDDDKVNISGTQVAVKLKNQFAAYLTGTLPVSEQFGLHARLGYAYSKLEGKAGNVKADADAKGFAYGVGASYMFDDKNGLRGDYTRVEDSNNWTVAYVRKF